MRTPHPIARASPPLLFLVVATLGGACSTITGASSYEDTTTCTGPTCSLQCAARGGTWNASAMTCTCGGGVALCNGICCGSTAPFCVSTSNGITRCSECSEAAYECGGTCCEQQQCLNASIGACGVAYGVRGQSCAGGLTCPVPRRGHTTEDADCCESLALPGGTFEMGRSLTGKNRCRAAPCGVNEGPAHSVTLASYRLDRFEVTVARFRKFVDAWDYKGLPDGAGGDAVVARAGWQSSWQRDLPATRQDLERDVACLTDTFDSRRTATWTPAPGFYENLPIVCVTWYEAFAFCAWDGGRLPTEAEWEYAAANGSAADLYPWGEAVPTGSMAVYDCTQDPVPCNIAPPFPAPVGSRVVDENRWGHRDLAGNVAEWVLDAVGAYTAEAVTNYANTTLGFRVVRSASYVESADYLRAVSRVSSTPNETGSTLGFRCARAP